MNRRKTTLVLTFLLLLVLVTAMAEKCPFGNEGESTHQVSRPTPLIKRPGLVIQNPYEGNRFEVNVICPGPPYPSHVTLTWVSPGYIDGTPTVSHQQYVTSEMSGRQGQAIVEWKLPVNQVTGSTETVQVSYRMSFEAARLDRVDTFEAKSDLYELSTTRTITRPPQGSGQAAAWVGPLATGAQLAQTPAAQSDNYYLWEVWKYFWPAPAQTMTASRCQDWMTLLQGGHAFVALRFPVLPPTLAYTEPYTLPVVFSPAYSPTLSLVRYGPYTRLVSVPLEYKPEYFFFLENELPAAPGEHWLALGAVATPTVDCSGVPTTTDWEVSVRLWLDFGGAKNAALNHVLPFYFCYEGQTPPSPLWEATADVASYQGWGITALGPQFLRLKEYLLPLGLYGMHTAWVTPTQTISFHHSIKHMTMDPMTVTLSYSSALGLPWGIYSGTADAPDIPLVPITGPVRLTATGAGRARDFWLIATVPPTMPWGAETLVITATDVALPTRSDWTSDVAWVGDWVAPPPPRRRGIGCICRWCSRREA